MDSVRFFKHNYADEGLKICRHNSKCQDLSAQS